MRTSAAVLAGCASALLGAAAVAGAWYVTSDDVESAIAEPATTVATRPFAEVVDDEKSRLAPVLMHIEYVCESVSNPEPPPDNPFDTSSSHRCSTRLLRREGPGQWRVRVWPGDGTQGSACLRVDLAAVQEIPPDAIVENVILDDPYPEVLPAGVERVSTDC